MPSLHHVVILHLRFRRRPVLILHKRRDFDGVRHQSTSIVRNDADLMVSLSALLFALALLVLLIPPIPFGSGAAGVT